MREREREFIRVMEVFFLSFSRSRNFMFCKGIWILLTCQENIRELYSFQFVSNDEKQKISRAVKRL